MKNLEQHVDDLLKTRLDHLRTFAEPWVISDIERLIHMKVRYAQVNIFRDQYTHGIKRKTK